MSGHGTHAHGPPAQLVHRRLVGAVVAAIVLATIAGVVLLWPGGKVVGLAPDGGTPVQGTVTAFRTAACDGSDLSADPEGLVQPFTGQPEAGQDACLAVEVKIDDGPDRGATVTQLTNADVVVDPRVGQGVVLLRPSSGPQLPLDQRYQLVDTQRGTPLVLLSVLFVLAVLLIGRGQGVLALLGLALSLLVIIGFLIPALLAGRPPILAALVGASAVMLCVLLLAHGPNVRTGVAVIGTSISLLLILGLSSLFVRLAALTGSTSEEAFYVRSLFGDVDLRGLLLAGMVIGALGILDDVTVTQVSTVWELRSANGTMSRRALYSSALRVGRDHIASTVNTLLLAYAGASLPLLVIVTAARQGGANSLTSSVLAEEIVRTFTGSIGLVAAVPVTTALAVWLCPPRPLR